MDPCRSPVAHLVIVRHHCPLFRRIFPTYMFSFTFNIIETALFSLAAVANYANAKALKSLTS